MIADPLTESVLSNLELLEGLGKFLDREYKWGGEGKCWKHLAEYFRVEAKIYEDFPCCKERSPTEDLFDHLKTEKPQEFTIRKLKDKLSSIDRQDVQDVLLKYQDLGEFSVSTVSYITNLFPSIRMLFNFFLIKPHHPWGSLEPDKPLKPGQLPELTNPNNTLMSLYIAGLAKWTTELTIKERGAESRSLLTESNPTCSLKN